MAGDDEWDGDEMSIADYDWMCMRTPGSFVSHRVAAPASELFSVRIGDDYFAQCNNNTCDIYGTIGIIEDDADGTSHQLFCRSPDDPQTLTLEDDLLSFNMPPELSSSAWSRMCFDLKDKSRDDAVIAQNQVMFFDKLISIHQYDQLNVRQIQLVGGGSLFVTYTHFRAAVVCFVDITLLKMNNDIDTAAVDVYGKIVVRYGNTYGPKYPKIVLFNRPSNHPVNAVCKVPIELSTDVLIVPAFSFIRIDLQLRQQQQDIIGSAEFITSFYADTMYLDVKANDFVFRVNVEWCHPYEFKNQVERSLKCPKIPDRLLNSVNMNRDRVFRAEVFPLLEIFSIVIHHNTNSALKIVGGLGVDDQWWLKSIFCRNDLNPLIISKNMETLPVEGPSKRCCGLRENMSMKLDLRDVDGRISIRGRICWGERIINTPITWYDRRICSVIPGIHGYALVFYTIFSKAIQATIKVSFISSSYPDTSHCVHSSMIARYSNEVYSSVHDKLYYQSVLFRGKSSELKSGCILPLLKSVVAVPIDACLIVDVDLCMRSLSYELPREHLKKDVIFGIIPDACICQRIEGKNYCIEVSLEWRKFLDVKHEDFLINKKLIQSDDLTMGFGV